jgi:hypothetical protein
MGFAGAGPADQHGIALLGDEAAAGPRHQAGHITAADQTVQRKKKVLAMPRPHTSHRC